MLFNSFAFFIFFPIVATVVILLRRRVTARNTALLAAGYYFYGQWDWRFLGLLALTTFVDFTAGMLLDRDDRLAAFDPAHPPPRGRRDRLILAASVCVNLTILGFFKYFDFFANSAASLMSRLGIEAHPFLLKVVLPVGVSFYTFQSIAYVVDVYRRKAPAERNLLTYATYVAFFPQLVAGPIERITHMGPQLRAPTVVTLEKFYRGAYLIGWGLFKKVVIADNMALLVDSVMGYPHPAWWTALIASYAFAIQIYCDFSGYTDIARGSARIMGFELLQNFDAPYLATNPQEFWRRWHISLSTWLRDYLYIPLGGSRAGAARTYINLMITMVLGGLWHGASWTFVCWGAFHGIMLCVHRAIAPWLARVTAPIARAGRAGQAAWWIVRLVVFFHLTCFGWLLFRAESLRQFVHFVASIVGAARLKAAAWNLVPDPWIQGFIACAIVMLLADLWQRRAGHDELALDVRPAPRALLYAGCILAFVLFGNFGGSRFIYFQF
jgi:D-alanyl-lipoteichoic acid acyltransferase DltB (MBOAT superfamily)